MIPRFEIGATYDRVCQLSDLIADFPQIIGFFTDSDCENSANDWAKTKDEMYYMCDYHLGQLVRSGLTDYQRPETVTYYTNDPNHSMNLPK